MDIIRAAAIFFDNSPWSFNVHFIDVTGRDDECLLSSFMSASHFPTRTVVQEEAKYLRPRLVCPAVCHWAMNLIRNWNQPSSHLMMMAHLATYKTWPQGPHESIQTLSKNLWTFWFHFFLNQQSSASNLCEIFMAPKFEKCDLMSENFTSKSAGPGESLVIF